MIERYLKNRTIMSIAGIVIGLVLMIWQKGVLTTLIRVMGFLMIVTAVIYAIQYLTSAVKDQTQIGYAVMSGIFGLLLVLLNQVIVDAFPIIMGLLLILNGAAALMQTWQDRNIPWYSKVLSALLIVLGVLIITRPGAVADVFVFLIGVGFVINGVAGLVMSRES